MRARGADAGVALDGDADRAILVTHTGRVLDGDDMLLIWARALAAAGRLPGNVVVATVMSNLGLEVALRERGIAPARCPVGDREVWETMERTGAVLGGEQSGHVICSPPRGHRRRPADRRARARHRPRRRRRPGGRSRDLQRFPQVLKNVRVATPPAARRGAAARGRDRRRRERLGERGRVLVRYSGTEPLLRIMVEADSDEEAHGAADELIDAAKLHLGVPPQARQ